jgi:8-oxo-dGTP diphosphatase
VALQLLPAEFTLRQLQRVYELILAEPLDKRNFRKHILARGCVEATGRRSRNGSRRPAMLYRTRAGACRDVRLTR